MKKPIIPFTKPFIAPEAYDLIKEVLDSGWITTGPQTKLFEQELREYVGCKSVVATNSASSSIFLALKWFGIGPGDEVIVPAYTYCATANMVLHTGATPVIVDVSEKDATISLEEIRKAITDRTKAIIPVDVFGFPVYYDEIMSIAQEAASVFKANSEKQEMIGRPLVLSDAAHSFGARYKSKRVGSLSDMTAFSFHAVKNLTTAEGGSLAINIENAEEIYKEIKVMSLHGQTKEAYAKFNAPGSWRYDVVTPGFKANMPDILAALGRTALKHYDSYILPRRKEIFETYNSLIRDLIGDRAILPVQEDKNKRGSYHVYALRINGITEDQRDLIIAHLAEQGIMANVHFIPLPLLTAYRKMGYSISETPNAYNFYKTEISLPVYESLTDKEQELVVNALQEAIRKHV